MMKGLKVTSEKGKGTPVPVRHVTSEGKQVRVPGTPDAGKKSPGLTKEAARGLGIKR